MTYQSLEQITFIKKGHYDSHKSNRKYKHGV